MKELIISVNNEKDLKKFYKKYGNINYLKIQFLN